MRLIWLGFIGCFLQACAGGGTAPNKGDISFNATVSESPVANKPTYITQLESTPVTTTDPNGKVSTNTSTYDLSRATPDPQGPGFNNQYSQGDWLPSPHLKFWGKTITSSSCFGNDCEPAKIATPTEDVLAAWRQGWTGWGVNVMIEDNIATDHGVVTGLLAYRYAPGAKYYGVQVIPQLSSTKVFDHQLGQFPSSYAGNVKLGVVNASYTALMNSLIGREQSLQNPWTSDELIQARTKFTWEALTTVNRFKDFGVSGQLAQFKYTDAVITKAAGNDQISSEYEPVNWFMAKDSSVNPRLLLVGALDRTGSVADPAEIASYSNTAGNDTDVSSRFLLASGTIPFGYRSVSIDGIVTNSFQGTSFAAPRVAGYVAILRSKFPNLNASQSASIMLDTAGYETLRCNTQPGGCDPKIYGKGEANLARALAPVGRLR